MSSNEGRPGFWQTLPGILTGIAAVLTAVSGLVVALYQSNLLGSDDTAGNVRSVVASIAGSWSGPATDTTGRSFSVSLRVDPSCTVGGRCGWISVPDVPCRGDLFLQSYDGKSYEFSVDDFSGDSSPACTAGPGEHVEPQEDGTLLYTTSYEPLARGVLKRTGD